MAGYLAAPDVPLRVQCHPDGGVDQELPEAGDLGEVVAPAGLEVQDEQFVVAVCGVEVPPLLP